LPDDHEGLVQDLVHQGWLVETHLEKAYEARGIAVAACRP
jgi:hypothetical protein